MRILFVTDFYHPYSGGVEIHVRTVANELASRGHAVAVATLGTPDGQPERASDGPIEVHAVAHGAEALGARFGHRDRAWAPPFPDPLAMVGLRRVVARFRPDVIHGHDWLARSVLPAWVSGGVPIITSLHYYTRTCAKKTLWRDDDTHCPGPEFVRCLRCSAQHYGPVRGPVVAVGLRLGAAIEDRRTARWISVSAATERGNRLTGRPNATVVANPLPTAADPAQAGSAEAGPIDEPPVTGVPDGPFILFVGDIRPEKGVTVLADALGLLRSEYHDRTPLVVVGERMSDRIDLPDDTVEVGPIDNATVQQLWRQATVGVIPSLWPEPFGLVAVEALAAGCPLVASRVGGLAEILADDRARLVSPGDASALALAMAELLADPEQRRRLADAGRRSVGRYAIAAVVDRIEELYRQVVAER